ncbi:MAG: hypothetical protein ACRED1_01470 [Limisphaerales bacterium]
MENDLTGIDSVLTYGLSDNLNGSTAPNSGAIPLSTPVNTSGGNTNTSGFSLGSVLSTLSGLGTSAANAYGVVNGTKPATTAKGTAAAASGLTAYLPYFLIGGALLAVLMLFGRK